MSGAESEDPEAEFPDIHVPAGQQAIDDSWGSVLDPEYVRAIPNSPPAPTPLEVPKSLTAFQGEAWNGLFCAMEELFYVMENIAGTDPNLEAALSRPMTSLLTASQQEDDSDDPAGDLIVAVRRIIDTVTGHQQSAPVPPELINVIAGLTEELREHLSKATSPNPLLPLHNL